MISTRQLFLSHVAQTSDMPMMLEVEKAEGMYIYDTQGKKYLDLNSGISVSSLGHSHPAILSAIKNQVDTHMHTMVYGEHIQRPQVRYAELLTQNLDDSLDSIYFLNSGSEAVETALKLARKYTGRYEIISCRNAYHGSTIAAESLRSDREFTMHFAPSIPGVSHIHFNDIADLQHITEKTACIILEPVQAEAGVYPPKGDYLQAVKQRCEEVGALMILDEIQTGFGRTGHLFAHQKYDVIPDLLLIGKAMGGGMPISGLVAPRNVMSAFAKNPMLGHITTFGGHPVTVAAARAYLEVMLTTQLHTTVAAKEQKIKAALMCHPIVKEVRSSGLMMAVELTKRKYLKHVVSKTIETGGLIDYFLFNDRSFRLAPPLIISDSEIDEAIRILHTALDYAHHKYQK